MSISHKQAFEDRLTKLTVFKLIKRFIIGLHFEADILQIKMKERCEERCFFKKALSTASFKVLKHFLNLNRNNETLRRNYLPGFISCLEKDENISGVNSPALLKF